MRDYVIDKISKLIFNRIFTKENKIFCTNYMGRRVALRVCVFFSFLLDDRFEENLFF